MPFSFNPNTSRYRDVDTGRFVKLEKVAQLSQQSMDETTLLLAALVVKTAKAFEKAFKKEVKSEIIRQYLLGVGGVNQMTPSDYGKIGAIVKEQYKFAKDFIKDYPDLSEAERLNRASMYIASAREGFEKGKQSAVLTSGQFTEELWVVDESKENCSGCIELAARGWVKIGELGHLPGDGNTPCRVRCGCKIIYRGRQG